MFRTPEKPRSNEGGRGSEREDGRESRARTNGAGEARARLTVCANRKWDTLFRVRILQVA